METIEELIFAIQEMLSMQFTDEYVVQIFNKLSYYDKYECSGVGLVRKIDGDNI